MDKQEKRILIVGGYGLVGGNIARLIRHHSKASELILAGRNPQKGDALANELGNARTAQLDLEEGFDVKKYAQLDLIIIALEDHRNVLREAAISHGIAVINITEVVEQISPTVLLSVHRKLSAPVVFAGHWQAGIMTLLAKKLATGYRQIASILTAGLYDKEDPIGPLVASQLDGFIGKALIRKDYKWTFVDAKEATRELPLHDGSTVLGHPMGTLDVPSIAAFTDAANIRFDFPVGRSLGSVKGGVASHDLYIDIEGISLSGEASKKRTILSAPKGQAHLTAVGVFLIVERLLGLDGAAGLAQPGLYFPETIVPTDDIIARLESFGMQIIQGIELT